MVSDKPTVDSIFLAAVELPPDQRTAYLKEACGNDTDLLARVELLLAAQSHVGSFLESPAPELGVTVDRSVTERPGTVIGPYKLLEQIGEGGFGVVFMAEQTAPVRRKVALKIIKPGMDTRQVIARFEAERQALALMDHPNIARVFDGGATQSGRPYFVMELVHGVPITEYCNLQKLSPPERLRLFIDVCRAVQHAHQKGIIHRDLKSSNVMVTMHDDKPVPKIIDFGVSKAISHQLTEKTLFTAYGQMVGTPMYMSPEQAQLSGLDVDTRSDVYALGVLLYELTTGTTPFDEATLKRLGFDEMRRMIREEEPLRPSLRINTLKADVLSTVADQRKIDPQKLSQSLRGEVDWIVMKCLEKDRNRRYDSANSVAADIERYLNDEPVQACPPSVTYRLGKFARRNKVALRMAAVLAAALLVLVIALLVSTTLVWRANQDLQQALEREQDTAYFQRIALAERELATNHAARAEELLNLCWETQRGWEWHLLKRQIHETPLVLTEHPSGVPGAAFSPNGQVLASSCWDAKMRLWDPTSGKLLRTLSGDQTTAFEGVAFSPNGQFLAAANWDGTVSVWDLAANQERVLKGHAGRRADKVAFSPDNRHLASTSLDKTVIVWDLRNDENTVLTGHGEGVHGVDYSPDGSRLATASDDQTVRVWDVRTGRTVLILAGHRSGVFAVAFSPDGRYLASGGRDRTVRLWDATAGTPLVAMTGHTSDVNAVAFSADGRRLASGGSDTTVRLWDTATGQEAATLRGHRGIIWSVDFSPDGWRLASAADAPDNAVRVWDATPIDDQGPGPLRTFTGHSQDVMCLAFSRDGRFLASGSPDRTVVVRDTATGEVLGKFGGRLNSTIRGVDFSPDGTHLAAAGDTNGILTVWNLGSGQEIYARNFPTDLSGLTYSPDGKYLAVSDWGQFVHILDATNGKDITHLNARPNGDIGGVKDIGGVNAVAYGPDGKRLAAGCYETVLVWDIDTPTVQTLKDHSADVISVAYRSDGEWLASAAADGGVILWNAAASNDVQLAQRIQAHRDVVNCVRFSPDGRRFATASRDGTVKLWDTTSGGLLTKFRAQQGEVFAVAFHPDGKTLASAGADGTVKMWEMPDLLGPRERTLP